MKNEANHSHTDTLTTETETKTMTIETYLNNVATSEGLDISASRNSYGITFRRGDREIGRAYFRDPQPAKRLRAYVLSLRGFARLQRHIDSLPPFTAGGTKEPNR